RLQLASPLGARAPAPFAVPPHPALVSLELTPVPHPPDGKPSDAARIAGGHYARKQIHCPSRVVAWSHGSRFDLARRLVAAAEGGRLLDYGCGDGTFVAMVHAGFAESRGV